MSGNPLRSGISRVDARLLLKMLHYISSNDGVTNHKLQVDLDLSRATVARLISNAKLQYGVRITWRRDNAMPSHGEYTIEDWGVFDPGAIREFLKVNELVAPIYLPDQPSHSL